jgi:hypothetical protein
MAQLRTIGLLAISLGFVALGAFLTVRGAPAERGLGLACMAFFGGAAIIHALGLFPAERPQPDSHGVTLIRPSRAQLVGLAVGSALMAAATPAIATLQGASGPLATGLAIGGATLFGGGALYCVFRLLQPRALYRLDHVGIASLQGGRNWFVPWRAVRGIDPISVAGQYWLALDVDPAVMRPGGLVRGVNRLAGFPAFTVGPQGSSVRFEDLAEIVHHYWQRGRLMQAHN